MLRNRSSLIQPKLKISDPNDRHEKEANRLAGEVMQKPERPAWLGNKTHPANSFLHKMKQQNLAELTEVPTVVNEVLSSPGQPLESDTRAYFEERFGHNLSKVRVHTNAKAAESALKVNAVAYTVGHNVVFGRGHYVPNTYQGRHLLAHELVHTIQHNSKKEIKTEILRKSNSSEQISMELQNTANPIVTGHRGSEGNSNQFQIQPHFHFPIFLHRAQSGPPPTPPAARRIIFIDANVVDQIQRGNQQAAARLKTLLSTSQVFISQQAYNELVHQPAIKRTATAQRLFLDDLGIKVGPKGQLADRTAVNEANRTSQGTPILSKDKDVNIVTQARATGGEVWSFDKNFRNNSKGLEARFGVKVAPESLQIPSVQGPKDYRVGRRLMALEEVDISFMGNVTRKGTPPKGGGGGTGPPPSPGGGAPVPGTGAPPGGAGKKVTSSGKKSSFRRRPTSPWQKDSSKSRPRKEGRFGSSKSGPKTMVRGMLSNLGAGFSLGILQEAFKEKILADLSNLPKPEINKQGAKEFLSNPKHGKPLRIIDFLNKNFPKFEKELNENHLLVMTVGMLELSGISLIKVERVEDYEKRFERLSELNDGLQKYGDLLYQVDENIEALLELETKAMESREAAEDLSEYTMNILVMDFLIKQGFTIEEIDRMDAVLNQYSYSIKDLYTHAYKLRNTLNDLIEDYEDLSNAVMKAWWNEFGEQLQKSLKKRQQEKEKIKPKPALQKPRPQFLRSEDSMPGEEWLALKRLRTRVETLMFEIINLTHQIENAKDPNEISKLKEKKEGKAMEFVKASEELHEFEKARGLTF